MRRRQFLGTVGTGLLLTSAGCLGGDGSTGTSVSPTETPTAKPEGTPTTPTGGPVVDPDLPLDDSDLVRSAGKDEIAAIVDPAFESDWSGIASTLGDGDRVVGVEHDGATRAYPLAVLNWHEVVNDTFGGPLLVTYCPLCGSGVTAKRQIDGRETTFGVSGYLWQRDLVLYDDHTDSLWSQLLAQGVRGPQTGTRLTLRPSTLTTWGEWRRAHPETEVLLPPPDSEPVGSTARNTYNYNTNPYDDYEAYERPNTGGDERRLPPKSLVVGVATVDAARAYPLTAVLEAGGVVNDRVGDLPVVVASTRDSLVAYVRRVEGELLHFGREDGTLLASGSRWNPVSGRARDGPHEGTTLTRANDRSPMFWFAWRDFVPGTDIYGRGGPD